MKKIILSSDGITSKKIAKEFLNLLDKKPSEANVLIVHSAKSKEDFGYLKEAEDELVEIGINEKNLIYCDLNKNHLSVPANFDVIYFCGGNTYNILNRIRKFDLDKLIKNFVKNGGFYFGVSAGSIIMCENIDIAGWGVEGDKNEIGLKNLKGLNLTNVAIFPHYKNEFKQEVDEFSVKVDYPVEALRDGEAIVIKGDDIKKLK
ncbi:MAG: peptidase E [Nanoarchaeota archaeon]|nr:peptidase E [Nanoarchaeota archaeon]MBU4116694.1 peptidase E [Nanoarchaeota archaeon]